MNRHERAVMHAAKNLDAWYRDVTTGPDKVFELDDLSDWELNFMKAMKQLRSSLRKKRGTR